MKRKITIFSLKEAKEAEKLTQRKTDNNPPRRNGRSTSYKHASSIGYEDDDQNPPTYAKYLVFASR